MSNNNLIQPNFINLRTLHILAISQITEVVTSMRESVKKQHFGDTSKKCFKMSMLKRIIFREPLNNNSAPNNDGISFLNPEVQKKLSSGVKYNMKIVVRGDRKSGKSSLFSRLKGETFCSEYVPTDEIKVACILWNYQPTGEVVKLDVWDVVDKGRQREVTHGNKMTSRYMPTFQKKSQQSTSVASLDSTFIDVYKGANGVILMFDITKKHTFAYIQRELPKVPHALPVLVVGNFRDAAVDDEREVAEVEVRSFIRRVEEARELSANNKSKTLSGCDASPNLHRKHMCAPIRYCEASMLNGFGLMYLHRFLNVPFLHLERAHLLQALTVNEQAYSRFSQQLDLSEETRDATCAYEKFVRWLDASKRQSADVANAAKPHPRVDPIASATEPVSVNGVSRSGKHHSASSADTSASRPQDRREMELRIHPQPTSIEHNLPQSIPINDAEEAALQEFLQQSPTNKASSSSTSKPNASKTIPPSSVHEMPGDANAGESLSNSPVPLVASFQEDIDPADTMIFCGPSSTAGPQQHKKPPSPAALSPRLGHKSNHPSTSTTTNTPTTTTAVGGDSAEDDLEDDDDCCFLNEDEDDDEEQLGPALGLAATVIGQSTAPAVCCPRRNDSQPSPSTTVSLSSSSVSSRGSLTLPVAGTKMGSRRVKGHDGTAPGPQDQANNNSRQLPCQEPNDLGTQEEQTAFERFLDAF